MKNKPLILLALHLGLPAVVAQPVTGSQPAQLSQVSDDEVWQRLDRVSDGDTPTVRRMHGRTGRLFRLNAGAFHNLLGGVSREFAAGGRKGQVMLTFPMPDGTFVRFRIVESPIMESELAVKFPHLRTYSGQGIDDPTMTVRFDASPRGLRGLILSPRGSIGIDPASEEDPDLHLSYPVRDSAGATSALGCVVGSGSSLALLLAETSESIKAAATSPASPLPAVGESLRVFRLAVAATGEFTQLNGGTVESAMAAIVATINRVNAIYEPDLAIRFLLVANNDLLIYMNPDSDPYTTFSSPGTTLSENQLNIDRVIGPSNYDVGHVFMNGRGNADFGTVCAAGAKARGLSGWTVPVNAAFAAFPVAHELGHQFSAKHSFNGVGDLCSGNVDSCCAYEPGSGSTIMGYTRICGSSDNLQITGDLYFHSGSFDSINSFVSAAACGTQLATSNHPPSVDAGKNYTIPARTPFVLTATGIDPDGDVVSYCWEERDLGPAQPAAGPGSADNGRSPLFRSFPPTTNSSRTFPQLADILNNRTTIGEQLPQRGRTMNFRVTARDHRTGSSRADMQVIVYSNAGPFVVLFPNESSILTGTQTVAWNIAGTTNPPISAAKVNILLSTNGGLDFSITLAADTSNDGSESVILPDLLTTEARIKIEAAGNSFFDISDTNFTIVPAAPVIATRGSVLLSEGCSPTNGMVDPGETVTVGFVLENIGAAPAVNLIVDLRPSTSILLPGASQTNGFLLSGQRLTNAFAFTAATGLPCGDMFFATVVMRDDESPLGQLAYPLKVGKINFATARFANPATITIAPAGPASPTPTSILVSNLADSIAKVAVTVSNFSHTHPDALDLLLVGPQGQKVLLLYGAAISPFSGLTFTFDDDALVSLVDVTQVTSRSYKPTIADSFWGDHPLPFPAPPPPYEPKLAALGGTNPNGAWRLYALATEDKTFTFGGSIAGGWSLAITTVNSACCHPLGLTLAQEDSPDPVVIGSPLTYTLRVTNVAASTVEDVLLTDTLPTGIEFLSASATQGSCGLTGNVVACTLGTLAPGAGASVAIMVNPVAAGTLTNIAAATLLAAGGAPPVRADALTLVQSPRIVSIDDVTVIERDALMGSAVFHVTLSEPSTSPVSVSFITSNATATAGLDYVLTRGTARFAAGESIKAIAVLILGGTLTEPTETFQLILSNPLNAGLGRNQGVGTILDNDPAILVSAALQPAANVLLTGTGPANRGYRLWARTNLSLPLLPWTLVTSNTFDNRGHFSYTDVSVATNSSRFYRLSVP